MWASWALEVASRKAQSKINAIQFPAYPAPLNQVDHRGFLSRCQLDLKSMSVPQSPTLTEPLAEPLVDHRHGSQGSPDLSFISSSLVGAGCNGRGPLPIELHGETQ